MKNTYKVTGSVFFIIATAFTSYHFFISKIESKERQVASFGERNSAHQIKWEQNLASELASADSLSVQTPTKINWQDSFLYEYLRGQYTISLKKGSIYSIKVQNQKQGLKLDLKTFMSEYAKNIKDYSDYEIKSVDAKTDEIDLKDKSGGSAGAFVFSKDDQGLVTEITVK